MTNAISTANIFWSILICSNVIMLYDQKNRFHVGLDCTCIGTYHCNYSKTWKLINLEASTSFNLYGFLFSQKIRGSSFCSIRLNCLNCRSTEIDRSQMIAVSRNVCLRHAKWINVIFLVEIELKLRLD